MVADPKLTGELYNHRALIEAELHAGEYLVWVGQPRPSRVIKNGWAPIIFSCFYLAIVFFGLWVRVKDLPGGAKDPDFIRTVLIFCPFVFAGGFLLTKPFRDISKATHLYYLITNERVMILVHARKTFIRSFDRSEFAQAVVHRNNDGSGDIWFSKHKRRGRRSGLIGLENVDEVFGHLEATR